MEKRIVTLVLVSVIAVLVGIGIVGKQLREPMFGEMLKQLKEISAAQKQMEKKLDSGTGAGQMAMAPEQSAQMFQRQQNLEQRIASLESRLQGMQNEMQQLKAVPPAPAVQGPPPEDFTTVYDIPASHTPLVGQKNAPVTIVEFVDFQCPFCARFHSPIQEVVKVYPGKVKYMVKNFPLPFHPQAKPAAKAAFAAGEQGKYAEMADLLLTNGQNLGEEIFKKLAKDLGLNADKFWKDYQGKDAQWEKYIQEDISLGEKVGVRGTPTFYLNGRKTNARDLNEWKKEIDQILSGSR